ALVCRSSLCIFECITDADCPATSGCASHSCVVGARGRDASLAETTSEASIDGGDATVGKGCAHNDDCSDGLYCNGIEQCLYGHCYPAVSGPCSSNSACVRDTCDETTHACTHVTLAPTDVDGDGHLDEACGGDDCDDHDPTVYFGHPELCDGKDNDCNGLIDDYAVLPRGAPLVVAPPTPSSSSFNNVFNVAARIGASDASFNIGFDATASKEKVTAQALDATGKSTSSKSLDTLLSNSNNADLFAFPPYATSGPHSALVLYDAITASANAGYRTARVVGADLSSIAVALVPLQLQSGEFDATWSGSAYVTAWGKAAGYGNYGNYFYGFIGEDGSMTGGGQIAPAAPKYIYGGYADVAPRTASNGVVSAVAVPIDMGDGSHNQETDVLILAPTGAPGAGLITVLKVATPLAIAGTTGGFVVLIHDADANVLRVVFISSGGVVGASTTLLAGAPVTAFSDRGDARGGTDGLGAGFAIRINGEVHFIYTRDAVHVEDSIAYAPTVVTTTNFADTMTFSGVGASDPGAINGHGGFVLGYGQANDQQVRVIHVGCL
ncbi:MAG: putative metal-binding motif-containing protein, partial [Polyangiales bacterium]